MINLEPVNSIPCKENEIFDEKYRYHYEIAKERICIIVEKHIPRDQGLKSIELWVCLWPGTPKEQWEVPFDIAISVPKYVEEQISRQFKTRRV